MAVKIYNKLKQDLLQFAQYVRGGFARKEDVKVYVGTCGTAAGTAAKVVSVDAFPTVSNGGATLPVTGTVIAVKFSNTNSAGSPTLNVNSTGAASIWYGSSVYGTGTPTVAGSAGQYTFFVWNGTYWVWQGQGIASSGGGGGSVGALNTNNATAQTPSSSESFSGNISLHKVSKTGSYNDLLNKPTIPSAQVQSDWQQNNPANDSHVKNRTHYKAGYQSVLSAAPVALTPAPGYGAGTINGSLSLDATKKYQVTITDSNDSVIAFAENMTPKKDSNNHWYLSKDWTVTTTPGTPQSADAFLLWDNGTNIIIYVVAQQTGDIGVNMGEVSYVKLIDAYIPDTIATVAYVDGIVGNIETILATI